MTVANATFGTRALFGAGDFAYSACALSARTFAPASAFDSLLIDGPGKLKLRRSAISHPAFLSASADGLELTPELTVISRRAHESALTASIPVPVLEPGVLVSLSPCLSEAKHYLSGGAASQWSDYILCAVAEQGTTSVEAQLPVAQHGTFAVEGLPSFGSACTPSLTVTAPWFHTHARFTYTTYKDQAPCRREARHCFGGACTLPKFGRALRL